MARFYFHVQSLDRLVHDEQGEDLPSLSAAQQEALLTARDLLANAIKGGREDVPSAVVIADERGRAIDTIPLAAVLPESMRSQSGWPVNAVLHEGSFSEFLV